MKVAVIGGGSSYTPELINGFLDRIRSFPLTELWLMDIVPERLEIVGGFARRMVEGRGAPFKIFVTTDQREAITDASYVVTQLRVGWMQARREDEYLGKRHGLIGQETTGVGGMAKALRTIPIILMIAEDMRELAKPGALLVNFTNPAGIVTEALARHEPDVVSVGVCNVATTTKMKILEELLENDGLTDAASRAELLTLGLNHLSWHRGLTVDGEDIWSSVIERYVDELRQKDKPEWDPSLIESLQMIPNYYLQYYYQTDQKLAEQQKWPPSRAEEVMDIEAELLSKYAEPGRSKPPQSLIKRGGAYYSTVATQLLNAHLNDLKQTHVVNIRHQGAVAGWPSDWVLELPSKVGKDGIKPVNTDPLPAVCFGLLSAVKMYELLVVEAAVHGDRKAAYQALLAHPLGPSADKAQVVLDDMLSTHKGYLPRFWS